MKKLNLIFILLVIFNGNLKAYESSEAFMVYLFEDRVKVLSPEKYHKNQSIIIQNKTLAKVVGKIRNDEGEIVKYVNILPGEFKSINIVMQKNQSFYFVPMVPSFQEVKLSFGKRSYEVPPKK